MTFFYYAARGFLTVILSIEKENSVKNITERRVRFFVSRIYLDRAQMPICIRHRRYNSKTVLMAYWKNLRSCRSSAVSFIYRLSNSLSTSILWLVCFHSCPADYPSFINLISFPVIGIYLFVSVVLSNGRCWSCSYFSGRLTQSPPLTTWSTSSSEPTGAVPAHSWGDTPTRWPPSAIQVGFYTFLLSFSPSLIIIWNDSLHNFV